MGNKECATGSQRWSVTSVQYQEEVAQEKKALIIYKTVK